MMRATWATCLCLLAAACKNSAPPSSGQEKQLVVFAAASLREAFTAMADEFKRSHAGVEVTFNFAGTQELRTQIEHGAPADVLAAADVRHMEELVRARRASAPILFARNEPVIVVARESVASIRSLADLPAAARIVIGAREVPIGRYTEQILDRATPILGADFRSRALAKVVSRELNVRQVLTKVALGEAQVGIVYRSDARVGGDSIGIVTIPADINVIAEYPIAVMLHAPHPVLAAAWIAFVLSPDGQRALHAAGFLPASGNRETP